MKSQQQQKTLNLQAVNDETNGTIKKAQLSVAVFVCAGVIPCVLLANSTVCSPMDLNIDLTYSESACVMRETTSDKVRNVRKSRPNHK